MPGAKSGQILSHPLQGRDAPHPGDLIGARLCQSDLMKRMAFPQVGAEPGGAPPRLTTFAWLSIAAALVTIALKSGAYLLTGSVGLLSDAAESGVNLIAAVVALIALHVAARPADDNHNFGHGKAEYFSAGIEGLMIFVAAGFILVTSVQRFMHPTALESVGLGLAISTLATAVNGAVGMLLLRAGATHRSVTLTADGKHLLTDVWTSFGVIVGVLLVGLTGWERLDPIVAALVGVNILVTGFRLVSQSVTSLLDAAMPAKDLARVTAVLDRMRTDEIDFANVRTRESGRHRFVSFTVLVPSDWTVERGHDLADDVEMAISGDLPDTDVQTHLEPRPRP